MKNADSFTEIPNIGFVIATKRVAEDEHKVCFMYREAPMDAQDSGWRIFAGDESQAYVNDPENSGIYQPAAILMVDDSIRPLLLEPIGAAYERVDGTAEWQVAEGYAFGGDDEIETQPLGGGWQMEISGVFDRDEDDEGDTVFASEGRTVRVAIWDFSDKAPEEIIALHKAFIHDRDQSETPTLEVFELDQDDIVRMGFLVEESDEDRKYKVLYGYTIIGTEVAQGAFYYDEETDHTWAMETWLSIMM
jgi:hypothetical protein